MSSLSGKVCAITGAGSGIGRALAVELARRGARVAISDIDGPGLEQTAALLPGDPHRATVDVSDRAAVETWAAEVAGHHGAVHQIYNNAGISSGHTISEISYPELERTVAINLWGVIHGTKAFLPHVIASGDGHVVNVSSLNGYFAQPELSAYVTTKFAVRGFTETLRAEMIAAGTQVKVSVVHPGGVRTEIASNALRSAEKLGMAVTNGDRARIALYNERLLRMDPARAAQIIADGVARGRPRIRVGNDAVAIDLLSRLAPGLAPRVAVRFDRLSARAAARR